MFAVDIIHSERSRRNAIFYQSLLEWTHGRMTVGFEQKFGTLGLFCSHHSEPFSFSQWDVCFLDEAEDLCVKLKRLILIVDKDTGDMDSHGLLPFMCVGAIVQLCLLKA
jgi:hypothetical protein